MTPSTKTLYGYLCDFAAQRPDDNLYMDEQRTLTVSEVLWLVNGLGNYFTQKGIKKGDIAALRATKSINATLYLLALNAMGAQVWLIDPHNSVFDRKEPVFYITNETEFSAALSGNEEFYLYINGEKLPIPEIFADKAEFELLTDSKIPTMLIFTSGSTGDSKGVYLSQYAFINNGLDTAALGDYRLDDVALCMIPIHHVFALALLICGITLQYSVFFPDNVDVRHLIECIDKYKITRINAVPALYKGFVILKGDASLETLRVGLIGGAPSTEDEIIEIEDKLHMKLLPVYGMSECIGISCTSIDMDNHSRLTGVGHVYSMNEVILVDPEGNRISEKGVEGEIRVKSPALASGYLNGPLDMEDGFLKTGDVGYFDEADILHVSGRIKDIIICNGLNISAIKVQKAIETLEGVSECAVLGVHDFIRGEIPCAFISGSARYTEDEIFEKLNGRILKFERPRMVVWLDELPKLSTGKIDRKKLISFAEGKK